MEIAARSGQDSDCNPSTAGGILGVMLGYSGIPDAWKSGIPAIADRKFDYTHSSLNDICRSTLARALELIRLAGGSVTGADGEHSRPGAGGSAALEQWDMGIPIGGSDIDDPAWTFTGFSRASRAGGRTGSGPMRADRAGAEAILTFTGAAVAIVGEMTEDGGRADVYPRRQARPADRRATSSSAPTTTTCGTPTASRRGRTRCEIVTRDDADPRSKGTNRSSIVEAVVYRAR